MPWGPVLLLSVTVNTHLFVVRWFEDWDRVL